MNTRFRDTYRIASARAKWWDYGWNGTYYITICTKNRNHYLGEIENSKMQLSTIGQFADSCWQEIPQHFQFVTIGEFVVMPNHIHGIVLIDKTNYNHGRNDQPVSTSPICKPENQFGPQSQNLASIIRGYKIGVSKKARLINPAFAWQSRYYDRIIRNDNEYQRIVEYISTNPQNWNTDKFNLDQP
jgi:putative transposase